MDIQKVLQLAFSWIKGEINFDDFLPAFLRESLETIHWPDRFAVLELEHILAAEIHGLHGNMSTGLLSEADGRKGLAEKLHYTQWDGCEYIYCVTDANRMMM